MQWREVFLTPLQPGESLEAIGSQVHSQAVTGGQILYAASYLQCPE